MRPWPNRSTRRRIMPPHTLKASAHEPQRGRALTTVALAPRTAGAALFALALELATLVVVGFLIRASLILWPGEDAAGRLVLGALLGASIVTFVLFGLSVTVYVLPRLVGLRKPPAEEPA